MALPLWQRPRHRSTKPTRVELGGRRPLVPPLMLVLWWQGILPGSLAAIFAVQDFASFLWTLSAWQAERRSQTGISAPPATSR